MPSQRKSRPIPPRPRSSQRASTRPDYVRERKVPIDRPDGGTRIERTEIRGQRQRRIVEERTKNFGGAAQRTVSVEERQLPSRVSTGESKPEPPVEPPAESQPITSVGRPTKKVQKYKIPKLVPKASNATQHVIMVEFLVAIVIILLRAAADYVPNPDDESKPGTEQVAKGPNPLLLFAATIVSYFILSLVAVKPGRRAQIAGAFGALMLLGLTFNSQHELNTVAGWFDNIGKTAPGTSGSSSGTGGNDTGGNPPDNSPGAPGAPAAPPTPATPTTNALGATGRALHQAESDLANFFSDFFTGKLKSTDFQQKFMGGLFSEPLKAAFDASNALRDGFVASVKSILHGLGL